MDLPGVSIADSGDSSMFSLSTIKKQKVIIKDACISLHFFSVVSLLTWICSVFIKDLKSVFSFLFMFLRQALVDISKGDMKAADDLVEEDDDLHLSEEEDDEADKMSLASDLDDEDMEEIEQKQKELEKKAPKKK